MKHKRQTLSKTGEDGDSKDSPGGGNGGGGGGGKSKSEKGLLLLQDENSKSCQNCDLPNSGGTGLGNGGAKGSNGGSGGGIADHSSNRANNNNSVSVANNNTNNNNSSFNSNSNASSGASSVASSIGSSFDKMVTEEDSRSNESSGVMTSPGASGGTGLVVKKLGCTEMLVNVVKVEVENKSPPLMVLGSGGNVGLGKKTPPGCMAGKETVSNSGGPGNGPMNSGSVLDPSGVVPGACAGSLTPSSTPGTPGQQSSPLSGVQSQSSSCGSGMAPGPNVMMIGNSGVTAPGGLFSQRPTRSSPTTGSGATIATATATASVTAVLQHHTGTSPGGSDMGMPPLIQIVRGAVPPPGTGGFQQQPQHEYRHCGPPTRADFRRQQQEVSMGMQQGGCYSPRNMFQHHQQRLMYPGSDSSAYSRQQQHHAPNVSPRINGIHTPVTTPRSSAIPPVQQQQQQHRGSYHHQATATQQQSYHQQQSSAYPAQHAHPHSSTYNGYHHPQTSEHTGYHAVTAPYQQRMHNHHGYQQTQSYPSGIEHEGYINSGSSSAQGYSAYPGGGVYPNSSAGGGNNAASSDVVHPGHPHHHMGTTTAGQQMHHAEYYTEGMQQSGTSVYGTPTHHMDTDYVSGPGMKSAHHQGHYYDHQQQHQHPHLMHQGGDASNIPSNYVVSSPDPFPLNSGTTTPGGTTGVTTTATAIAAATAAVMTPPASVQTPSTDSGSGGDGFNSFHHFYSEPAHHHHHPSGENSNSSSDFNFLSNLANDFAPEYYQLS